MSVAVRECLVMDLGRRDYAEALSLQRELAADRIAGRLDRDVLVLVEHPPVITMGRATKAAHLLANTLNLLAHSSLGIDAASALCQAVSCFELDSTDPAAASDALRAELDRD